MNKEPAKPTEKDQRPRPARRTAAVRPAKPAAKEAEAAEQRLARRRNLAARALVWAGISLVCGLVLSPPTLAPVRHYSVGEIAETTLKAPRDLAVEDVASTLQRQDEARSRILPVYDYDEEAARGLGRQVSAYFGAARQTWRPVWDQNRQIAAARKRGASRQEIAALKERRAEAFDQAQSAAPDPAKFFPKEVSAADLEPLGATHYAAELEEAIAKSIEQILRGGVIGSRNDLPADPAAEITVRRVPSNTERVTDEASQFADLEAARKQVEHVAGEWLGPWQKEPKVLAASRKLIRTVLRPNLAKNIQETDARRERAAQQVKPVYLNLKAGEVFVREGERVSAEDVLILGQLTSDRNHAARWLGYLGVSLMAALAFGLLYYFATRQLSFFRSGTNDLQFYAILLALELALIRLSPDPWYWGGYVAYGAMLIRLLLPAESAFLHATVGSVVAGLIVPAGVIYVIYSLLASMAVVYLVSQYQHRGVVIRAGAALGALSLAGYWADLYLNHGRMLPPDWKTPALLFGLALVGPVVFVYLLSPLAERFFNYTSAIRLMELNDPNHPLVKEVFFKAPGTYQHSLVIGTIAEAAAKTIDGDALLMRVSALYHDIGKTKMPQYFIENLVGGEKNSPHNKLSPNMSAIIIASHVKDGVEMAREAGLPQRVIDMIPQHHGTKLMKYFWSKANEQRAEDVPPPSEDEFRYPGPKPQSREGGIMLLADAAEAAVRTLPEFTEARIRGAIQKIINDSFADGQLSECDLTLKDLNEIARAFTKTLAAFHHNRIKYPEPAEKYKKKAEDGDSGAKVQPPAEGVDERGQASREENLKRLGS